uniref:Uncharacterized protein n=1 Tax=Lutzomyia longipalpis TaxID=7200 RepID=A0A1B0ET30_LUTLO
MENENLQENCQKEEKIKNVDVGEANGDAEGSKVAGEEKLKFTSKWVEENDFDASSSGDVASVADESTIYTSSVTESDAFSDVVRNFSSAVSLDAEKTSTIISGSSHKIITLDKDETHAGESDGNSAAHLQGRQQRADLR